MEIEYSTNHMVAHLMPWNQIRPEEENSPVVGLALGSVVYVGTVTFRGMRCGFSYSGRERNAHLAARTVLNSFWSGLQADAPTLTDEELRSETRFGETICVIKPYQYDLHPASVTLSFFGQGSELFGVARRLASRGARPL